MMIVQVDPQDCKRGDSGTDTCEDGFAPAGGYYKGTATQQFVLRRLGLRAAKEQVEGDFITAERADKPALPLYSAEILSRSAAVVQELEQRVAECEQACRSPETWGDSAEAQAYTKAWQQLKIASSPTLEAAVVGGRRLVVDAVMPSSEGGKLYVYVRATAGKDLQALRNAAKEAGMPQALGSDWERPTPDEGGSVVALPQSRLRVFVPPASPTVQDIPRGTPATQARAKPCTIL